MNIIVLKVERYLGASIYSITKNISKYKHCLSSLSLRSEQEYKNPKSKGLYIKDKSKRSSFLDFF